MTLLFKNTCKIFVIPSLVSLIIFIIYYLLRIYTIIRRSIYAYFSFFSYIKRETATFFGVDEESEAVEKQKWLDRRRRMALRKYGTLLPEYRPPDPDITKDVPDFMDASDVCTFKYFNFE
jgi:hypothetical protein